MLHRASQYRAETYKQACLIQWFGLLTPLLLPPAVTFGKEAASHPLWNNKENSQVLQSLRNPLTGPREKRNHRLESTEETLNGGCEKSRGGWLSLAQTNPRCDGQ